MCNRHTLKLFPIGSCNGKQSNHHRAPEPLHCFDHPRCAPAVDKRVAEARHTFTHLGRIDQTFHRNHQLFVSKLRVSPMSTTTPRCARCPHYSGLHDVSRIAQDRAPHGQKLPQRSACGNDRLIGIPHQLRYTGGIHYHSEITRIQRLQVAHVSVTSPDDGRDFQIGASRQRLRNGWRQIFRIASSEGDQNPVPRRRTSFFALPRLNSRRSKTCGTHRELRGRTSFPVLVHISSTFGFTMRSAGKESRLAKSSTRSTRRPAAPPTVLRKSLPKRSPSIATQSAATRARVRPFQ